jgi:hypothetical protein
LSDNGRAGESTALLSRTRRRIEQSKGQHQYFFHLNLTSELNELIFKATLMSKRNNRNDMWVPSEAFSTHIFQSSLRKEITSIWYGR